MSTPRDPRISPAAGDTWEGTFSEKMFPTISDEETEREWIVRVFGVDGDSHVAVKLYGVGRQVWDMDTYRQRVKNAKFLNGTGGGA